MSEQTPRDRSRDGILTALEQGLVAVARPNPLVIVWRWRYEIALAVGLPWAVVGLTRAFGPWETAAGLAVLTAVVAAWPSARRALVARLWCIVTPHRIRTACAQERIHNRQGKLPVIVRTSPAPYGERVLIWCRAGISPRDFESSRPAIAVACWAQDVVVTPHARRPHLVVLSVIRRADARSVG